jgi:pimeloyl-ACP methyl ester carboxylesterase
MVGERAEEQVAGGHGQPDLAFPVEQVTIHGQQIAYRRGGEGPALLFLHGIAGSSRTWVPAMKLLCTEYTMIAPDFLGHGHSDKPMGDYSLGNFASSMRDLLQVLDIDRVTVVGQSFGGGVAMQFAYQFPEHCERLVLVDAGGLGREVSWALRLCTLPGVEYVLPALFPSFARGWGDAVARLGHRLAFRNAKAVEIWRSYRSLTDGDSRRAFLRTMRSVIEPGGQSVNAMDRLYLAEQTPTLIVWGGKDKIIPLSHAFQALDAMPNSRLEVLPGAGHFPQAEEPARFVEVLRDFLRTTEPSKFAPKEMRERLGRGPTDSSSEPRSIAE